MMETREPVLQALINTQPVQLYHKGRWLYGAGKPFSGLFVVMSGVTRLYRLTEEGDELVTGFCLPGEWCGLPDLSSGCYTGYAQALDTCAVRCLPAALLGRALAGQSSRREIYTLLSDVIRQNKTRYYQITKVHAGVRFAMFIQNLSLRYSQRGYSSREFCLPMTRSDIANYLGLTPETISREITKLERRGVLIFRNRYITIQNSGVLEALITNQ
ncbi:MULTISPECIES: helix-turn-helix domain-containing protein [Serratia]|uniref:helix-turn-helix domain-containing protein n=1 Tax=Serratia TaxID=613 RepID=UPI00217C6C68|nr:MULTISPECIES: helix-turn-helix domain-containing protein [Serratia]CAI0998817.1 Fumarate and nitrate reduction regulatory protein [Serratia quinivorans]CAI1084464.1 Fumarate and nitrate reduction regulatory protein [Serratia quinivorans]CAI2122766.1 Fumarate and nitrate reduction regulatory protein [Serratia quinivorans]CAI2489893.1 Fumarate and nitrate reduction regulatory protein [Serratia liquefaciens]